MGLSLVCLPSINCNLSNCHSPSRISCLKILHMHMLHRKDLFDNPEHNLVQDLLQPPAILENSYWNQILSNSVVMMPYFFVIVYIRIMRPWCKQSGAHICTSRWERKYCSYTSHINLLLAVRSYSLLFFHLWLYGATSFFSSNFDSKELHPSFLPSLTLRS